MDYELAKQLRDAGFPIRPYPAWALAKDGPTAEAEYAQNYIPTFEELIEACGERFGGVIRGGKQETDGRRFSAFQDAVTVLTDSNICDNDEVPHAEGSTPTEAVARLWLALRCLEIGHDMKSGLDDNTTPAWLYCRRCGHSEQTTIHG